MKPITLSVARLQKFIGHLPPALGYADGKVVECHVEEDGKTRIFLFRKIDGEWTLDILPEPVH